MKSTNSKKINRNAVTKDQLFRALSKSGGMKTIAARMLDKCPAWMSERCKDPEVIEHLRKVEDERLDRYEEALDKLMTDGNTTAIIFYLKTKGRGRGYIEHAPSEHVSTAQLSALRDFFSAVPKREPQPQAAIDDPQAGPVERHEPRARELPHPSAASSSEKRPAATQSASAGPGLSTGKIVRIGSNFP